MTTISILMYHQVGRFNRPETHRALYCNIKRFKAQMAYLHGFGYRVVSLDDALAALQGKKTLSGHAVVLTFDDGYQNFYDHAYPVLRQYDFPATVFVVSALIGRTARWFRNDGRHDPPLMDGKTLRKLSAHRISIGAHTRTHRLLGTLDDMQLKDEIVHGKAELEATVGKSVRHFCYPSGDFNEGIAKMVESAGFSSGLTCIRGAATDGENPFTLPRKAISYGDSLIGFWWKLHMKHKKKIYEKTPDAMAIECPGA